MAMSRVSGRLARICFSSIAWLGKTFFERNLSTSRLVFRSICASAHRKDTDMTTGKALYTPVATVRGGRTGTVTSNDGRLSLNLPPPHVSGDSGVVGTNPEQL